MNIFRTLKDPDNPYTMVNKEVLKDVRLSWKSKGLLVYLLSLPDDWKIYESELVKHSSDGIASLKTCIKELKTFGYIKKEKYRNNNGEFNGYEYWIYENPDRKRFSDLGETDTGEMTTTNKDSTYIESTNIESTNIYTVAKATGKVKEFVKIYEETFNIPYRKITIDEFTHDDIISLDIYDFSIRVNEFFKLMGYDKNKCTLEYINKTFNRLL